MTKLKLEVGRYYRTRDGRKVGLHINHDGGSDKWPFYHDCGDDSYHAVDQFGLSCIGCRGYDIIAEWSDTPTLKVGDKVKVVAGYGGTLNGRIGEVTQFDGRNVFVASHQGLLPQHFSGDGGSKFHLYFFGSEVEPIPTIGTLAEIGAQVGDVVEYDGDGVYTVGEGHTLICNLGKVINYGGQRWKEAAWFRIISRASDDIVLTDEEMAIIEAAMADERPKVSLDDANDRIAEVLSRGPVITETVKRIVPGVYGKVSVGNDGPNGGILVDLRCGITTRADLIAARDVFSALIDAMPDSSQF